MNYSTTIFQKVITVMNGSKIYLKQSSYWTSGYIYINNKKIGNIISDKDYLIELSCYQLVGELH